MLHLDFETRSACDLKKEGVYRYASDPTTEIMCASYAFGDDPVQRWLPGDPYPFAGYDGPVLAWNAGFERLMWDYVLASDHGWPVLPLERFQCVAAQARANALPSALDKAARALRVKNQKDMDGHRLMMKLCRPKTYKPLTWFDDPDELARLYDYCDRDVETERAIHKVLRPLSEFEWNAYWDTEHINDRGLCFDRDFAECAVTYAEDEAAYFAERIHELSGGMVSTTRQFQRIKTFLLPRLPEEAQALTQVYRNGEKKTTFDKAVRHNLLELDNERPGILDPLTREFIEIVNDAGRSSVAKYRAMVSRNIDGRLPGLYLCFGAGQTGRFSSLAVQVHNLMRDVPENPSVVIDTFKSGDRQELDRHGTVINLLAKSLRPTFHAQRGKSLIWSDWSAIEARALPWLSGSKSAQPLLDRFAANADVYTDTAEAMGFTRSKEDRQIGKVAVLSLGFAGGVGAFRAMAEALGVRVDDALAERIKCAWRETNPWAPKFWNQLEDAAIAAIRFPSKPFNAGRVTYYYTGGTHNGLGTLWCKLPCGRILAYPEARVEKVKAPWGAIIDQITAIKGNWHPKQTEKDWPRFRVWKGLLTENVTQATCASLLMHVIGACLDEGLDVVGHTHDEILIESEQPEDDAPKVTRIMETGAPWSAGLPLNAETAWGWRYKEAA